MNKNLLVVIDHSSCVAELVMSPGNRHDNLLDMKKTLLHKGGTTSTTDTHIGLIVQSTHRLLIHKIKQLYLREFVVLILEGVVDLTKENDPMK